jgi:hypothetical protein
MTSLPRIQPNPLSRRPRREIQRDIDLANATLEQARRDRDAINYDDMTGEERRDYRAHCRHVDWLKAHLDQLKIELRGAEF